MPEGYEYYLTQTLSVGEVPQSKTTPLVLMFDQLGDGFHSCSTKKTTPTIRSNFLMFIQSRFKKTMNTTTKTEVGKREDCLLSLLDTLRCVQPSEWDKIINMK